MKTRIYSSFSLALALSTFTFLSIGRGQNAEPGGAAPGAGDAPPPPAAETDLAAEEMEDATPVEPAPANAEKKLPAAIKPTPPTAEVIKLAQAGVDEAVMLNFITNSGSMFVLSSDDIIYLNDLGVNGSIVTAMMQHDQGLKANWPNPTTPLPQAAQPAAAPTYVNPPPPEQQPQPQPPPAPAETAPPPANVTYFHDSLSPYGNWVNLEGYGYCWQPTVVVVNPGWRPYCDRGRWIYSDAGWYWMSDYSWGATTFHYGRWLSHPRYGWCWWPDRVWAPSWVSWRYSGDYCGWAPLPPAAYYQTGFGFSYYGSSVGVSCSFGLGASCFTFVSWNHFRDPHPYHYRVPSHHAAQIYGHTTIVNNYGVSRNNTVINHGIPADRVREQTHTDLRPVAIREHTPVAGRGTVNRGERLEGNGRSLVVSRPRIPDTAAAKPILTPPRYPNTTQESARHPGLPAGAAPANLTRNSVAAPSGSRVAERGGQTETSRERYNRPGSPTSPRNGVPGSVRPTPTAPPTSVASSASQPYQDNRPQNFNRPPASPATVTTPNNRPAANAPATPGVPSRSPIVIGRSQSNSGRDYNSGSPGSVNDTRTGTAANVPRTTQNWPAPTPTAPAQKPTGSQRVQSSVPDYSQPPSQTPRPMAQENRYAAPQPNYTTTRQSPPAQTYSAPTPAPVQRNYSSAPAYRPATPAPTPAPAPAYSAPPPRPQNAETRSAPPPASPNQTKRAN